MKESDVLDGRFRLEARAGAGAMGVVFRALDLARGAPVAVKVLRQADPTDVARFEREAEVLVALQHPSVVRYVAHGRTPANEPFLVMEWLAGETLKDRVARGPLATLETVDVGLALASALAGAHARGVVHRDVKPANVFLVGGSARNVKLLDFGVAALRRRQALTEVGAIVGTPAYMSPEQARGGEVDARSDVFSLGALLFHCIAGVRPFEGDDLLSIVLRIVRERAPWLASRAPGAPAELARIVDAMLEPTPEGRPSLAAIAATLNGLRAAAAPSLTSSHVVPIAAKATLVQPSRTAFAGPVLAPQPPAPTTPPLVPLPEAKGSSPARAIAIAIASLTVVAAVVVTFFLTRDTGRKHKRAAGAKPSSSAVEAEATSSDTRPAKPQARPESTPCDKAPYVLCEPLKLTLAHAEPDAFIAECMAVATRYDAAARLGFVTMTLAGDYADLTPGKGGNASCLFTSRTGNDFMVLVVDGYFVSMRSGVRSTQLRTLDDGFCRFATAYPAVEKLFPRGGTLTLSSILDRPTWILQGGDHTAMISATTCAVEVTR